MRLLNNDGIHTSNEIGGCFSLSFWGVKGTKFLFLEIGLTQKAAAIFSSMLSASRSVIVFPCLMALRATLRLVGLRSSSFRSVSRAKSCTAKSLCFVNDSKSLMISSVQSWRKAKSKAARIDPVKGVCGSSGWRSEDNSSIVRSTVDGWGLSSADSLSMRTGILLEGMKCVAQPSSLQTK